MAKKQVVVKNIDSGIVSFLLAGAALVTLYFNTKIQDPFNSPKLWILSFIAAWSIGHIIYKRKEILTSDNRIITCLVLLLNFFGLVALLKTDSIYIGFFGESQRRNGFLSYFSLSIILLISALVMKFNSVNKILLTVLFVSSLLSIYGLLQSSGLDFVKWNNPYNSVISTLGNPNFAASVIAILATLNFGAAMQVQRKPALRLVHALVVALSLYVIVKSGALQGLIVLSVGVGTILLVFIFDKSKKLGLIGCGLASASGILAVLGMLQIGPLTQYLYKNSVSVRGYYWRAGLEMFKENPIFGVGLDRYGAHFKQVREATYSLNYGFDITSNNAHNVPIQVFATGGVFFGVAYLAIISFILFRGVKGLRKYRGEKRIVVATFFGAWLAFQAQTIISIDNIGISIWGWLLGGIVIGLGGEKAELDLKQDRNNQVKLLQPLVSGAMVLIMVFIAVGHYRNENLMYQTRAFFNPQDAVSRNKLLEYANKTISTTWPEPAYVVAAANYLFAAGFQNESLKILNDQVQNDERDLDALISLVQIYEQQNDIAKAKIGREKIRELDPWNTKNLLQLGREYKYFGEIQKMKEVATFISNFDSTSNESKLAQSELVE